MDLMINSKKMAGGVENVTVTSDNTHSDKPTATASVNSGTLNIAFTGLAGAQGPTGPAGPQGQQGPKGDPGITIPITAEDIGWSTLKTSNNWNQSFETIMKAFLKEFYNLNEGCFMAGTLVATPKGDIPIEEIKVGDIVYAYDFSTEEIVGREVLMTHHLQESDVLKVTFSDGQVIKGTARHRFYEWDDKKWTKLGDFKVGDIIKTVEQEPVTIIAIEPIEGTLPVYNLTVKDFQNFFIITEDLATVGEPANDSLPITPQLNSLGELKKNSISHTMVQNHQFNNLGGGGYSSTILRTQQAPNHDRWAWLVHNGWGDSTAGNM